MGKKKLAWIVDSTAHIPPELANHPDLYVVPLNVHFGDREYIDGIDLRPEQLYEMIRTSEDFPKTSQPSAGKYAELFEHLDSRYERGICITLASVLSGTHASAVSGAGMSGFDVCVIDSNSVSYGITGLVLFGMNLQADGKDRDEIADAVASHAGTAKSFIYIGRLNQLYKGGRMGSVQFYLGSMLQIKPIIQITPEGRLEVIDKVRSEKRAFRYLADQVGTAYRAGRRKIRLMHANSPDEAARLKEKMQAEMPDLEIEAGDIGSVLAAHAGEGTMAAIWYDFD
ncbi:DegV family protein [Edaphobacillus lindanitolerans]|uniref:EDD domain protein, DegV family n=1 Tax=Edaphobacillus lindanitolerans TaxID=550447 RepID=A0A1U7PME9_9BACI|nr:DegV family protein [Edaphobacillus lindanitolerans]SIT70305.1 EDD domain protein, DegV family [Edaphobacillus lindanitolerans]